MNRNPPQSFRKGTAMATSNQPTRRLIEEWLPIKEISIEAIRERSAASALPPVNWLHVWLARRPLTVSRAAVAASLMPVDSASEHFYNLMGTHSGIVERQPSRTRLETGPQELR